MTLSVRIYSSAMPSAGPVPLLGALQILLDCLRNKVPATIETEDGELLVSSSENGQYTAYKEGLSVALKIMDSVRADEYRRGYGDALDWLRAEQELARLRREEQVQNAAFDDSGAQEPLQATYQEDAAPAERAPRQERAAHPQGEAPRQNNNNRNRKRDSALDELLKPKSGA